MDVAVTIVRFKHELKARGYAEATIELYRAGLDRFGRFLAGRGLSDLRQVTRQVIVDYQAEVMAGTQSLETKALRIRPVKRLFENLTEASRLLVNPAEGVRETFRTGRKIGPTLSREQMRKLMEQPNPSLGCGLRDRAAMETLYATALRAGELLGLEVRDVDLKSGVVMVRRGKGGKERVVPLGKTAGAFLKEYLEKVRPRAVRKNAQERRLFLNCKGEPMTYHNLRCNLRKYARQAGIEGSAAPHTFRRSSATHMLQAGADIRHIQELLGHRSLEVTQRYTRSMPVEVKKTHEETHPNGNPDSYAGIP